jgi:hypothetical protein
MSTVPHRHERRAAMRAGRPAPPVADVAGPINVAIESLVLHGVVRSDAPRVTAAFRSELTRLVAAPRTPLIARSAAELNAGTMSDVSSPDSIGRGAAATVLRGLRS